MQYTIEARHLTNSSTGHPLSPQRSMVIEAHDEGEAISRFLSANESELVSFHALEGRESIATVKKDDAVFLVRVYQG